MRTAAILTAAGSGSRLGHPLPKALVPLAGLPLVTRAARGLVGSGVVDLLVVTVPDGHRDDVRAALGDRVGAAPVVLTEGGASRQASVAAALAVLPADVDVVVVHDAARALTPPSLVRRVVAAVRAGHAAVVPGVPVTDTLVQVGGASGEPSPVDPGGARATAAGGPPGTAGPRGGTGPLPVTGVADRSVLRAVQTPQGFDRALLERAHAAGAARAGDERSAATDDSSLVALLGEPVVVVDGDERALKVTTPQDLALAHVLLAGAGDQSPGTDGTGTGDRAGAAPPDVTTAAAEVPGRSAAPTGHGGP